MKIAVQISGIINGLQESYLSLQQQILNNYDCDIFFVTIGKGYNDRLVIETLKPKAYLFEDIASCKMLIDPLVEAYQHKTTIDYKQQYLFVRQRSVLLAMYSKMLCNTLRLQSDYQYDIVISTRTDLKYGEPLVLKYIQAAQKYVLIPMGFDWDCGINDLFQIGPPDHMTTVCNQFNYYQTYMDMGFTTHPENLFRMHLNYQQVPYNRFSYTMYLRNMRTS